VKDHPLLGLAFTLVDQSLGIPPDTGPSHAGTIRDDRDVEIAELIDRTNTAPEQNGRTLIGSSGQDDLLAVDDLTGLCELNPTARSPRQTTRSTVTRSRRARFRRTRAGWRYIPAVVRRSPPRPVEGKMPTPIVPGALWSST
jgi:hypothetical protein